MAKVGLVTVLFNSEKVLEGFFKSLSMQSFTDYHLYIIDNSANDQSAALVNKLAADNKITTFTYISNEANVGVATGNNQGIELAIRSGATHTLLLNNDIEFYQPELISDMLAYAEENNESMVVPKMLFFDNKKVQATGGKFLLYRGSSIGIGEGMDDGPEYNIERYVDFAPTCFALINNQVFEKVGLMDEKYFVYYDDSDFMFRAYYNSGYKIKVLPSLHVYHKESSSTGGDRTLFSIFYGTRNRIYFIRKNLKGFYYAIAMLFTLATRIVKYIGFDKDQRKKLLEGISAGFKL